MKNNPIIEFYRWRAKIVLMAMIALAPFVFYTILNPKFSESSDKDVNPVKVVVNDISKVFSFKDKKPVAESNFDHLKVAVLALAIVAIVAVGGYVYKHYKPNHSPIQEQSEIEGYRVGDLVAPPVVIQKNPALFAAVIDRVVQDRMDGGI